MKVFKQTHIKKILFFLCILLEINADAQVLPTTIVENKNISSGHYSYCSSGKIISPSTPILSAKFSGTSIIDYTAAKSIELLPGFSVSNLLPGGKFTTAFYTPPFPVMVMVPNTPGIVGHYEKLEYGLDLPVGIDNLVAAYFINNSDPTAVNPFDPEDITIEAVFSSPSGTQNRLIHGFYYRDFIRDENGDKTYERLLTPYDFRVRFAPTEIGDWSCNIKVSSPNGKFPLTSASCLYFQCKPSTNNGYLKIGQYNRQLKFSKTNNSFFAIGQDIPWIHREGFWNSNVFPPYQFTDFKNRVANIGDNQGNYVRFLMAPWSHCIEWEKLGDYSEYIATDGSLEDRQHNAYELDKLLDECRQKDIYVHLNLEMQTSYNANTPGSTVEPLYHWEYNPYKTVTGVTDPLDVLSNALAKKYFKRRLYYIIARWGYSTNLAVLELLSEQDGWDNYGTGSSETDSYNWHQQMTNYIKTTLGETNHLLSTCYADRPSGSLVPAINNFHIPNIDITSAHKYGNGRKINVNDRFHIFNKPWAPFVAPSEGLVANFNKPTLFGELGMGSFGSSCDVVAIDNCDDVSFHNSLWSTSFMGGFGTGLNWWNEYNDNYRAQNYPGIRSFFNSIDFESNNLSIPEAWKEIHLPASDFRYETFSLRNPSLTKAIGWAHNATYWWGNISENCTDGLGVSPATSDIIENDSPFNPINYSSQKVSIGHLAILRKYDVDWYFTRLVGPSCASETKFSNIFGVLRVYYPGWNADYAFKAVKHGLSFKTETQETFPIDTLLCGEDSIVVDGRSPDDVNNNYSYFWDFGNGQTTANPQATAIYTVNGTYNVMYVVTDSLNNSDTLRQQIVVWDCSQNNRLMSDLNNGSLENSMTISPNPNNGLFTLNTSVESVKNIIIYDIVGKIVYEIKDVVDKKVNIDLTDQSKGIYILRVTDDRSSITQKIIKQ